MDIAEPTPEALQRKLYFLLEQLQDMARELPPKYQMRVPIELLSGLANCLLNDTVFEIVKGLMEIQHVTEKHLFQQRLQIINKHTLEIQQMINSNPSLEQQELQRNILLRRHKEELKQTDMKLVIQLDQKVSDQQSTLEKAGVPGFFVTDKPIEVKWIHCDDVETCTRGYFDNLVTIKVDRQNIVCNRLVTPPTVNVLFINCQNATLLKIIKI